MRQFAAKRRTASVKLMGVTKSTMGTIYVLLIGNDGAIKTSKNNYSKKWAANALLVVECSILLHLTSIIWTHPKKTSALQMPSITKH